MLPDVPEVVPSFFRLKLLILGQERIAGLLRYNAH